MVRKKKDRKEIKINPLVLGKNLDLDLMKIGVYVPLGV